MSSDIRWIYGYMRQVNTLMAFSDDAEESQTLDFFIFCNATGEVGVGNGESVAKIETVGVSTEGVTTVGVSTTEGTTVTGEICID